MTLSRIIHTVVKQAGSVPTIADSTAKSIMIPTTILIGAGLASVLMFSVTPPRKRVRASVSSGVVGVALGGLVYGFLVQKWPSFSRLDGAVLGTAFVTGTLLTKAFLLALDQLPQAAVDTAKSTLVAYAARIAKQQPQPTEPGQENP